jgi:hypothetical protein
MTASDARIAALEAQVALQTRVLRRIVEGKLEGLDGAAADVIALEGQHTNILVGLVRTATAYRPTVELGYPGIATGEGRCSTAGRHPTRVAQRRC